ncbi:MAG: hypothetical protein V4706_07125 [Pseudomonadota bacterium]
MSNVNLSDSFYFVLKDGDKVWPSTMAGRYRISHGGEGHNILGQGEQDVSESEMIDGVLNQGKVSRFRSKTNESRVKSANHFSLSSPSVAAVYVNVFGVDVRFK